MTDTPTEREGEGAWARLRRRKVVQWGLASATGSWALLQVIGFAGDTFDWPRQIQQIASIGLAVGLPFDNRSRLDDDVFFVDGIHYDILTQLSKVGALKVISRTSVEKFRDTQLSMKEIAEQLGVTSILEGRTRRARGAPEGRATRPGSRTLRSR